MTPEVQNPTLTEFLLARIAEDECAAQAASTVFRPNHGRDGWTCVPGEPAEWVTGDGYGAGAVERTNGDPHEVGIVVYDEGSPNESEAAHIARHDPARVLAECEAKRGIIEVNSHQAVRGMLDAAVKLHAATYSDHPDYRPEWRP